MAYYIENTTANTFARADSMGEHDGKVTQDIRNAAMFSTWGDASDYSQNFGPDFNVTHY